MQLLSSLHTPADALGSLKSSGLQGPHAFIRGLNADYDQDIHLSSMLQTLPESDDFRFTRTVAEGDIWVLMRRLPWDCEFFSRGMARLDA